MKKSLTAFFLVPVLIAGLFGLAFAVRTYLNDFNALYGTSGTALNSCNLCHTGSPTVNNLNAYANDYVSYGYDFAAIQGLDSDGDGYSNLAEIQAGTFPGDPASHPSVTPPPPPPPPVTPDISSTILWRNAATGQNIAWHLNGAVWAWGYTNLPAVNDLNWTIVGTGDFNADGKTDIVWSNASTGRNTVWFMDGTTWTGQYSDLPSMPAANWRIAAIRDFNGDGNADIFWHNTSTGLNTIWFMTGVKWNGAYTDLPTVNDPAMVIAGVGEFSGDGQTDILWRNTATGQVTVWQLNGGVFSASVDFSPTISDPTWTLAGTGDFNNDGKTDIIWRNTSSGQITIWFMNGNAWSGQFADLTPITDPNWKIVGR